MVTSEMVKRLTLSVGPCIKQILPWYQERDFDHYRGPRSNKNALSAGTLWSWLQAQGWTRDSAVCLVIISGSGVQGFHCCGGKIPFTSWGCDCSSRSQMVFAAFLIHSEEDVCVLPWDLLMKVARGAQRLSKDLDSGNNRNSATHRLQLCLHNNSNYCKTDNFIFNFLLPLLSWAAQKPNRKNLSHSWGVTI